MQTVLITGASRGIGKALALAFAKAGYAVGLNARPESDAIDAVRDAIRQARGEAELFLGDVRDSLRVRQLMDQLIEKWGRLDVLVNNAGLTRDRTILKMTNGEWNDVIDTNLSGSFWCLREAARLMCRPAQQKPGDLHRGGAIINIASILGVKGGFGNANYSASKAGVIGLTRAAARELGRFAIRVNAVLPGFHETALSSTLGDDQKKRVLSEHVLGQTTTMDDLCAMTLALAENRSVSGQIFNVDSRVMA